MKEKIENSELQRLIKKELRKATFEEISDEEIEKLEGIEFIQSFMDGKPTNVRISDICFFPNLVRLNLVGYEITPQDMEMIAKFNTLDYIEFDSCSFSDIDFCAFERLPQLMCFFRCANLPENYYANGSVNLKLMNVNFNEIPFEKVKCIRIENCIILNAHDIEDYPDIDEVILNSCTLLDSQGKEVKDIKVAKDTRYTHTALEKFKTMDDDVREESIR